VFSYLDPDVRVQLARSGKLFRINAAGQKVDLDAPGPDSPLLLDIVGPTPLPILLKQGECTFDWYAVVRRSDLQQVEALAAALRERKEPGLFAELVTSMAVNSVLVHGDPKTWQNPLARVHSSCVTGDVFGSLRCECGPQLLAALDAIAVDPAGGLLVYMAGHEGRGIGLWAKAMTYLLQDAGQNTYQANRSLGLPDDCREFDDPAAMLLYFLGGDAPVRLMTNNPKKLDDLARHGLTHVQPVGHLHGVNAYNRRYLEAKRAWGHRIGSVDRDEDDR